MAQKLTAQMPDGLNLDQKYTISFTALDPTTGAPVSGVNVSLAQIHAQSLTNEPLSTLAVSPLWIPVPVEDQ